ncbi:MAG: 30S ribosomal protein S4 [Patescibacteria group bacterium]
MAKYTESKCKQCLREHQKLYLKGSKCYTSKCPFLRRNGALPGSNRFSYKRQSNFAIQFREKQKIKRMYGVLEKQFRRYYDIALQKKGDTGLTLLQVLERRFDNVVFRMGYAPNRATARQLVTHGHFTINGRSNNIPSTLLNPSDVVELKIKSMNMEFFKDPLKGVEANIPSWISVSKNKATIESLPEKDFFDPSIQPSLVVEYYSR